MELKRQQICVTAQAARDAAQTMRERAAEQFAISEVWMPEAEASAAIDALEAAAAAISDLIGLSE